MSNERTVFSQILDFIPRHQFRACVNRYKGNYRIKSFSCFDQYLTMAFAQLTYRERLRDIETCLIALDEKLYRCGLLSGTDPLQLLHNSFTPRVTPLLYPFVK